MTSTNIEKVRIVVVGDSGVGKTCLTHLIATNECLIRPGWTVGCNIEVKLHEFKEGTPQQQPYFIEFYDIGGSLNHKNTRSSFYFPTHGIILVHDLTNRKSHENLLDWLFEILNKDGKDTYKSRGFHAPSFLTTSTASSTSSPTSLHSDSSTFDLEEFLGSTQIPILVIGTKLDLLDERRTPRSLKNSSSIAEQCGAEEIWLNCRDTRSIAAGTTDAVKLSRFYDCVIEKRVQHSSGAYYSQNAMGMSAADRRRAQSSNANSPELIPKININSRITNQAMGGMHNLIEAHDLK